MKRITAILASLLLAAGTLCAQELTNFAFWGQKPVISPEVQNDSVTFRLKADYATIVKLSGSWMPGWGGTIDMTRGENNVWSVTIPLPEPEIYTYNFVAGGDEEAWSSMGSKKSPELDAQLQGIKKAGYKLYWLACGNTDFLFEQANELDAALTENGLEHTYFVSEGGHTWANWRQYLNTFAPLLFK